MAHFHEQNTYLPLLLRPLQLPGLLRLLRHVCPLPCPALLQVHQFVGNKFAVHYSM